MSHIFQTCVLLIRVIKCIIELNWLCKHIKKVGSSQPAIFVLNWIKHNFSLWVSLADFNMINYNCNIHPFFLQEPVNFVETGCSYFFFIFEAEMFLICSYFPYWTLQCHKECQTEYNKNTISFLSFFFFQAAHIGSHWEVFYKKSVLQLC